MNQLYKKIKTTVNMHSLDLLKSPREGVCVIACDEVAVVLPLLGTLPLLPHRDPFPGGGLMGRHKGVAKAFCKN